MNSLDESSRADKAEHLKMALFLGHAHVVQDLLAQTPDLGRDNFGLACALYDIDHVRDVLAKDPEAATRTIGIRRPITHLAYSQHIHAGGRAADMLAVVEALVNAGADVNDTYPYNGDEAYPLPVLYGAIAHAKNMALVAWLLEHGANPNDNESLYHSTELGHHEGLKLLLKHGAKVRGTNAIPRALDFNDHGAVKLLLAAGGDPNEGLTTLHHAARRMCDGEMITILLEAGADPSQRDQGVTPFAMASVYGNEIAADLIAKAGGDTTLTADEALLAIAASDAGLPADRFVDPARLPNVFRDLLRSILHIPGKMVHMKRLVAIGLEYDRPDSAGVPPVQSAGWEGLPEVMQYFLKLKPDLSHVNNYGGTLLGTILHGSENCGERANRDHIGCARLALQEGVALPKRAVQFAGNPEMAAFLTDWADTHPGQVVDD